MLFLIAINQSKYKYADIKKSFVKCYFIIINFIAIFYFSLLSESNIFLQAINKIIMKSPSFLFSFV